MAVNSFATRSTDVYESRQPEILKKTIPFMVLATLAVIARYFSRRFRKASLGADDYFSMASLVSDFTWFIYPSWEYTHAIPRSCAGVTS